MGQRVETAIDHPGGVQAEADVGGGFGKKVFRGRRGCRGRGGGRDCGWRFFCGIRGAEFFGDFQAAGGEVGDDGGEIFLGGEFKDAAGDVRAIEREVLAAFAAGVGGDAALLRRR